LGDLVTISSSRDAAGAIPAPQCLEIRGEEMVGGDVRQQCDKAPPASVLRFGYPRVSDLLSGIRRDTGGEKKYCLYSLGSGQVFILSVGKKLYSYPSYRIGYSIHILKLSSLSLHQKYSSFRLCLYGLLGCVKLVC
jgi:hypothetical protein